MPSKTKAATATAIPETKVSYKDKITTAITILKERNGSSRQAIKKYIQSNFESKATNFDSQFNLALRRGVETGAFLQPKGASGPVKIAKVEKTKPAVKAAAKPAAKKAATKTAAAKPAAKKAVAAKPAAAKPAAKKVAAAKPAVKKAAAAKPAAKKTSATKTVPKPAAKSTAKAAAKPSKVTKPASKKAAKK